MKAILKSGKIINGRLAEIFASRGIAREIKEKEVAEIKDTENIEVAEITKVKDKSKRVRRTKEQIKADKKK